MMIVMEYAAGGTLHDYLESKAVNSSFGIGTGAGDREYLDEAEIAHLFAQIVLPLHLVHEEHILHRDLKTQNIFLTKVSLDLDGPRPQVPNFKFITRKLSRIANKCRLPRHLVQCFQGRWGPSGAKP